MVAIASTLLMAFGAAAPPRATAAVCPAMLFVGARGSGEGGIATGHLGSTIKRFYDSMNAEFGEETAPGGELLRMAINYPATSTNVLIPRSSDLVGNFAFNYYNRRYKPFGASIEDGVAAAISQLKAYNANCPNTFFVLAGYSQGAMVMHTAQLRLIHQKNWSVVSKIWAVILVANGDRVSGTRANKIGSAAVSAQGIRSSMRRGEQDSARLPSITVYEVCARGDLVCDFDIRRSITGFQKAAKVHTDTYRSSTSTWAKTIAGRLALRWYD